MRSMLDDTLVIWGGEFGRTPFIRGDIKNRPRWVVIIPVRLYHLDGRRRCEAQMSWGASDDLGFNAAVDPVHVHDLQATILKLMGIDHEQLTYRFQGAHRLTDVHGKVVDGVIS